MVINPIIEHLAIRARTVGEDVNRSLKLPCMHHRPHSLTGDLGGGRKYLNIKQARKT
jgi:hypothetical protein